MFFHLDKTATVFKIINIFKNKMFIYEKNGDLLMWRWNLQCCVLSQGATIPSI